MDKSNRMHALCKGEAATQDCGLKYWLAWEEGRIGATRPERTVMQPKGFCSGPTKAPKIPPTRLSNIGSKLHEIIHRETGIVVPCDACKKAITMLNNRTPEDCIEHWAAIVEDIVDRAQKQAPRLWQRIAVAIDKTFSTGIAAGRIGGWLDEAIETGRMQATE